MGTSLLLLNLGDLLAFGSTSPTPNTARMAFIIYCSQRSLAEIQQVGVFLLLRPSDIWNCRGWLNSRKLQVSCDTCSAKVLKKKKAYCSVLMKDVSKPTCGTQCNFRRVSLSFPCGLQQWSSLPHSYLFPWALPLCAWLQKSPATDFP